MIISNVHFLGLYREKLFIEQARFRTIIEDSPEDYFDNGFGFAMFLLIDNAKRLGLILLLVGQFFGLHVLHLSLEAVVRDREALIRNAEMIQNNRVVLHDKIMSSGEDCVSARYDIQTCKAACNTFSNFGKEVAMDCRVAVDAKFLSLPRPTVAELKKRH